MIEEALTEEDPGLSVTLGELAEKAEPAEGRRVRRTTWIYVAVSVVVLLFGLVVAEAGAAGSGRHHADESLRPSSCAPPRSCVVGRERDPSPGLHPLSGRYGPRPHLLQAMCSSAGSGQ